jgi:hypothetical protein
MGLAMVGLYPQYTAVVTLLIGTGVMQVLGKAGNSDILFISQCLYFA